MSDTSSDLRVDANGEAFNRYQQRDFLSTFSISEIGQFYVLNPKNKSYFF